MVSMYFFRHPLHMEYRSRELLGHQGPGKKRWWFDLGYIQQGWREAERDVMVELAGLSHSRHWGADGRKRGRQEQLPGFRWVPRWMQVRKSRESRCGGEDSGVCAPGEQVPKQYPRGTGSGGQTGVWEMRDNGCSCRPAAFSSSHPALSSGLGPTSLPALSRTLSCTQTSHPDSSRAPPGPCQECPVSLPR